MPKWIEQSINDISRDTGLSREQIEASMIELTNAGLLKCVQSHNGYNFYLVNRASEAVNE